MENFQKLKLKKKPQPRTLEEMKPVLKNPEITEKIGSDKIIYDVFREVKFKNPLRYDITFIYPVMLGDELPKTFGHCHKNLEIMEVVSGEVLWFLQKHDKNPKVIKEAYLIHAKKGEKVIFPSDFGTISINPTTKETVLSNWMNSETQSNYEFNKQLAGGCYYFLDGGKLEKNQNYEKVPELIRLKPKELPELGIIFKKQLINYPSKDLKFLINTEKYKNILTIKKCYTKI